jgi:hypothetical protein
MRQSLQRACIRQQPLALGRAPQLWQRVLGWELGLKLERQ